MLMGYGICASENANKAYDVLLEEFTNWGKDGITDEELADAKMSLAQDLKSNMANDTSPASWPTGSSWAGRWTTTPGSTSRFKASAGTRSSR